MTYNEWKDELKSNLLCVSESERRRVLDYYAEAYADRRDAGFTEREIIDDFGAPYDAAQRILSEDYEERGTPRGDETYRRDERKRMREEEREERERRRDEERRRREAEREEVRWHRDEPYRTPYPPAPEPYEQGRGDYTWLFVLLCIVLFWPIFGIFMAMFGITVALIAAPFGILIGGFCEIGAGIGAMVAGNLSAGLGALALGVILCGVSVILIPLCIKLVKWMWLTAKKLFLWVKSQFSGRRYVG